MHIRRSLTLIAGVTAALIVALAGPTMAYPLSHADGWAATSVDCCPWERGPGRSQPCSASSSINAAAASLPPS
jgi:hypothetical protein